MCNGSDAKSLIPVTVHSFRSTDWTRVVHFSHASFTDRPHEMEMCEIQQDWRNVTWSEDGAPGSTHTGPVMSDSNSRKVLVRRPSRITTDGRGRSVWADPVESAELELVSTQMLKVMLTSRDDTDRNAIREAANTETDGVLARDPRSGGFEIIDDDELQAILDVNQGLPKLSKPADATLEPLRDYPADDELSLVSTQALRKVLRRDEDESANDGELPDEPAGFNPYDNS